MHLISSKLSSFINWLITGVILLLLIVSGFYLFQTYDPLAALQNYLEHQVSRWFFIVLMTVLPIIGVPVSVFLILVGMKFGITTGLILSGVLMFTHMVITYFLVHSFLREWIIRLMLRFKIPVPVGRKAINHWHAFILMVIPGLPYVAKNNLLAMTNISLAPYLYINWTAQFGLSIPFVLMGSAIIEMNYVILGLAFILAITAYLFQYAVRRKMQVPGTSSNGTASKEPDTH